MLSAPYNKRKCPTLVSTTLCRPFSAERRPPGRFWPIVCLYAPRPVSYTDTWFTSPGRPAHECRSRYACRASSFWTQAPRPPSAYATHDERQWHSAVASPLREHHLRVRFGCPLCVALLCLLLPLQVAQRVSATPSLSEGDPVLLSLDPVSNLRLGGNKAFL